MKKYIELMPIEDSVKVSVPGVNMTTRHHLQNGAHRTSISANTLATDMTSVITSFIYFKSQISPADVTASCTAAGVCQRKERYSMSKDFCRSRAMVTNLCYERSVIRSVSD